MELSQSDIIKILLDILINAIVVFLIVKILPEIDLKNFMSSIWVVIVYAILNALITYAFNYFGLQQFNRAVSQGLFQIVFNAVLLMIVDKFLDGFYVKNFWYALLASFVFAIVISFIPQYLPV
ncbi:MAG: phage holin family protein [Candidatus Caenarcaniphilales bacterium]|nr:phage holin family protein [Candidatus Caenarcaniphilales bacterium]